VIKICFSLTSVYVQDIQMAYQAESRAYAALPKLPSGDTDVWFAPENAGEKGGDVFSTDLHIG
jgi:hypothetical protein